MVSVDMRQVCMARYDMRTFILRYAPCLYGTLRYAYFYITICASFGRHVTICILLYYDLCQFWTARYDMRTFILRFVPVLDGTLRYAYFYITICASFGRHVTICVLLYYDLRQFWTARYDMRTFILRYEPFLYGTLRYAYFYITI